MQNENGSQTIKGLILYKEQNVYGQLLKYPKNAYALFICKLSGSKTITYDMKRLCEAFGLEVKSEEEHLRYRLGLLEKQVANKE
jgi:hypothetical protein